MRRDLSGEVLLSLGSNVADGHERIGRAVELLTPHLRDVCVTDSYRTPSEPAPGHECADDGRPYLNAVMHARYDGTYDELYALTKRIEHAIGRRRGGRCDVPVDIDIVVMDGCVMRVHDYESAHFQIGLARL